MSVKVVVIDIVQLWDGSGSAVFGDARFALVYWCFMESVLCCCVAVL